MEQLSPEEAGANRAGETITGTAEDTATIGAAVMTAAIRMKVIGAIRAGVIITEGEGGLRTITPGAVYVHLLLCWGGFTAGRRKLMVIEGYSYALTRATTARREKARTN